MTIVETLRQAQAASRDRDKNSGAGAGLGTSVASPAHPLTVGAVGFAPNWTLEDSMAASIVRLENELTESRDTVLKLRRERSAQDVVIDELRAEVALLKQGMLMLAAERDEARAKR